MTKTEARAELTIGHNQVNLAGDVTFETVASLFQSLTTHIKEIDADSIVFDLSDVNAVNSAALALMIEASKLALASQKKINFQNLPKKLTSLAQVCGVDKILSV